MYEEAVRVRDRLAGLVDRLDPDAVSGPAARELWVVLDAAERLCAAGKTLLARRVAATHRRCGGSRTPAEELARRAGTGAGAARDALETSTRLPGQPALERALRSGQLSPAQAALISAAAAADPGQTGRLTGLAPGCRCRNCARSGPGDRRRRPGPGRHQQQVAPAAPAATGNDSLIWPHLVGVSLV